jgi:osmotically-inducible protein OsmY
MESSKFSLLVGGIVTGAGAMYVFDPHMGRQRRAILRDKAVHVVKRSERLLSKASRDVKNRAHGVIADFRSRSNHELVDDDTLLERVRSKIGRVASHLSTMDVKVSKGHVTLSGPTTATEVASLLKSVAGVPGVMDVENRLEIVRNLDTLPGLQGRSGKGSTPTWLRSNWPPAVRLAAGSIALLVAGAALLFGRGQTRNEENKEENNTELRAAS